jgi:hypothetical protein
MTNVLLTILSIALVASALALAREVRLRKAVEKLLRIILSRWRSYGLKNSNVDNHDHPSNSRRQL